MTEKPLAEIANAMVEAVAKMEPTDPAKYRRHILKTQIYAAMERWGFDRRFQVEHELHAKQKIMLGNLIERMAGTGAIVALIGNRGLGKTTIAAEFAKHHAWLNWNQCMDETIQPKKIQHVLYKKAFKLIARFKPLFADFGSTNTEALTDSMDYLCRHQEHLVIDEVHEAEDLKMKSRILTDLIDRRYSSRRDTILICNQTADDFEQTIGDSILSRLNEHGCILECNWPTFRVQ